jgi:hypothetical protein
MAMSTLIGTTPCPQILGATMDETTDAVVQQSCQKTSTVHELDVDAAGTRQFQAECPDGHIQYFGEYYLPNVALSE